MASFLSISSWYTEGLAVLFGTACHPARLRSSLLPTKLLGFSGVLVLFNTTEAIIPYKEEDADECFKITLRRDI